jgi:Helix-turn-helix domain
MAGPDDNQARFLRELRQLRDGAGLGHAELAARAHYPCEAIRAAEAGPALPDLPVLSAYVRGCGGTVGDWEERWRTLTSSPALPLLPARTAGCSDAATAGARIGSTSLAAEGHDPMVIMAALSRVADGIATEPSSDWSSPGTSSPGSASRGSAAPGSGSHGSSLPGLPSRGSSSPGSGSRGSSLPALPSRGSASPVAASARLQRMSPPKPVSKSGAIAPTAAAAQVGAAPAAGSAPAAVTSPRVSSQPKPEASVPSSPTSPGGFSNLKPWITTAVIVLCMVVALIVIFSLGQRHQDGQHLLITFRPFPVT